MTFAYEFALVYIEDMNTAAAFLVCGIAFLGLLFGAEGKYEAISANAIFHEPVLSVLDFPMGERMCLYCVRYVSLFQPVNPLNGCT